MTAAHQTAMETVARVERFGMTGMAVLGTGTSRSPAQSSFKTPHERVVQRPI
jgi:hypothetical protein